MQRAERQQRFGLMTMPSGKIPNFSILKARKAQKNLFTKIVAEDRLPQKIRTAAGVDVAYLNDLAIGAVAVFDYKTLELIELQTAKCQVRFPYVPTLLSFRETAPSIACISRIKQYPDVFLIDGQGIAHPFGCGLASHLGLVLGKPTIGVAKSRLIGKPTVIGNHVFLVEKSQVVGAVITTKEKMKPVYVSVGHLVSLGTAIKVVKHCVRHNRIPEPLFQAHRIATKQKQLVKQQVNMEKI